MARPYQALRKSTLCILAEDVIGSKPIPSHYYFEKKAPKISDPIVFMLFFGIFRNGVSKISIGRLQFSLNPGQWPRM